jgi:hypothetical protein
MSAARRAAGRAPVFRAEAVTAGFARYGSSGIDQGRREGVFAAGIVAHRRSGDVGLRIGAS